MEPFIAEIIMFGGNFAPRGWAFCDGQLLPINQNQALFSILGTTFGGDGRTTFGLPDLRGRVPVHPGTGPGLSNRRLGAKGGTETNTLTSANLPPHQHNIRIPLSDEDSNTDESSGNYLSAGEIYRTAPAPNQFYGSNIKTENTGSGQSVNNMQPFQGVNFIIALIGIYPSRS